MIAQLTGKVIEKEDKAVILDVAGVGYRVFVSTLLKDKLAVGATVMLPIYHHVSDSDQTLFGFEARDHLQFFHLLLSVPSVGPRTAMNILDMAAPHVLAQAVASDDKGLLTKISGIGKKTAERILVELKGKMTHIQTAPVASSMQQEAVEALVSIGYAPAAAREAVAKVPASANTVEEVVREALKRGGRSV
jgi:Holliday junction DNA helicase RuvA